jgi:hypothetical protein
MSIEFPGGSRLPHFSVATRPTQPVNEPEFTLGGSAFASLMRGAADLPQEVSPAEQAERLAALDASQILRLARLLPASPNADEGRDSLSVSEAGGTTGQGSGHQRRPPQQTPDSQEFERMPAGIAPFKLSVSLPQELRTGDVFRDMIEQGLAMRALESVTASAKRLGVTVDSIEPKRLEQLWRNALAEERAMLVARLDMVRNIRAG